MLDWTRVQFALAMTALLVAMFNVTLCARYLTRAKSGLAWVLLLIAIANAFGWLVQAWREEYGMISQDWMRYAFIALSLAAQGGLLLWVIGQLEAR